MNKQDQIKELSRLMCLEYNELNGVVEQIAGKPYLELSADYLKAFQTMVTTEVANGGCVKIRNFINFYSSKRSARVCVSPLTGRKIDVAASVQPRFKASKKFKITLNPVATVAV